MALVTTVTPATIAVALGQAAPASGSVTEQRYSMWIDDALMLIQARLDDVDDDTVTVDQARLDYVIRKVVAGYAQQPEDITQVSTSVDDASIQKTYRAGKDIAAALDKWWGFLGLATASGSAAFSFQPYGTSLGVHQPWCNLYFGALDCSCGADLTGYAYPLYEF